MVKMGSQNVQSEDDIQGDARPLPGQYHAVIKDVKYMFKDQDGKWIEVDESDETAARITFTFEVLAGTVPGQDGRCLDEHFYLTDKAINRLQRLALCVGLLQPGEGEKEVLFSQGVGRQLVIDVEENEWESNGKSGKRSQVTYLGMYSIGNKAVADVPKNQEALKLQPASASSQPSQSPSQQQQPQEAAAASSGGGDKWANL